MARSTNRLGATLLAVLVAVSMVGGVTLLAATGTAAADQHEPENAPTFNTSDGGVEFRITLPHQTDHYPGDHPVHSDQNGYNASIEYFATGQAAFTSQDAEEGLWLDFILVEASWIDYSECDVTGNTKVFGIDRGNDNDGTKTDESLVEHRRESNLRAGGLDVYFYNWEEITNDPPYLSPEDAVVAAQGAGSEDGPCLKMTSDPGWYQVQAYTNGSIATECNEEGNSDCKPENKQWRGVNLNSNWVYICECDSEQQAREQLGPPPNEGGTSGQSGGGGGESTPTPAPNTPTPTQAPDTPTPTQAPDTSDEQQNQNNQNNQQNQQQNQNNQQNQQQNQNNQQTQQRNQNNQQDDRATPTISDGPGFTPVAALVALLAAALAVLRRQ